MDLEEDTTMDRIYGWKLKMKIADGNCGWSALGLLDAGPKSFKIRWGLEVLITGNIVFCKKGFRMMMFCKINFFNQDVIFDILLLKI